MAMGNTSVKLSGGTLINYAGNEVIIFRDTCDICSAEFFGTEHNDPQDNEIELAISLCGRCC